MRIVVVSTAATRGRVPGGQGSWWRQVVRFLASHRERVQARRRGRASERRLASLPDYLLADIGLERTDLAYALPRWLPDHVPSPPADPASVRETRLPTRQNAEEANTNASSAHLQALVVNVDTIVIEVTSFRASAAMASSPRRGSILGRPHRGSLADARHPLAMPDGNLLITDFSDV